MTIHRPTWYKLRTQDNLSSFPCPSCEMGKVRLAEKKLAIVEPQYSINSHGEYGPEPYSITQRWAAELKCDEAHCGEIVYLTGDSETVEEEEFHEEYGISFNYIEALRIRTVFPPLPIFKISNSVPKRVKDQLLLAFQIYWTDTSACVARLRTAIEAMLDEQSVVTKGIDKNQKPYRLNLSQRIDAFTQGLDLKTELQGLRNIGNLGTHGNDNVEDDDLFDAFDVLEHVLNGVYNKKLILNKASKLSAKKSK
ncbi:DUF4145 domain-containing protein [Brucella sp. BE17]|uniref:DUF4145 domain-containing protein n=1 Tax=Brucella sp. BE17 TaxID=3142977 RepID=UPI0031BA3FFC